MERILKKGIAQRIGLTALKMAVLAPMATARIATTVQAKPGFLRNWRSA